MIVNETDLHFFNKNYTANIALPLVVCVPVLTFAELSSCLQSLFDASDSPPPKVKK